MNWYVLYVRTGREPDVRAELLRQGYQAAVPMEQRTERKGGAWHSRERIVIPGYVFIQTELTDEGYYRIRGVPGVIRFLGPGRPEALPEEEADYIRWLANGAAPLEPSEILLEGSQVTVMTGPLQGRDGVILRVNRRQRRAVLAVTIAGQRKEISLSVNILKTDAV